MITMLTVCKPSFLSLSKVRRSIMKVCSNLLLNQLERRYRSRSDTEGSIKTRKVFGRIKKKGGLTPP